MFASGLMMVLNAIRSNFLNVPKQITRTGRRKKSEYSPDSRRRKAALVALRSRWADVQNEHLRDTVTSRA